MPIKNSTKEAITNSVNNISVIESKQRKTKEQYKKYGRNKTFALNDERNYKFKILGQMYRLTQKELFNKLLDSAFDRLPLQHQKLLQELAQTHLEFENFNAEKNLL